MRKAVSAGFNKKSSKGFCETQMTGAVLLGCDWVGNPSQWDQHIRRAAASTTLSVVYGHPPLTSEQQGIVELINDFSQRLLTAVFLGAHLVHIFPWLRYLPSR